MSSQIKAYVDYNEYTNTHYFKIFEIEKCLPGIGEFFRGNEVKKVETVSLDCEQTSDDIYDYDYYIIETTMNGEYNPDNNDYMSYNIAVEKDEIENYDDSTYDPFLVLCESARQDTYLPKKLVELSTDEKDRLRQKAPYPYEDWREFKPIKERLKLSWNELKRLAKLCAEEV